jgi:hypothetical protein
VFGLFCFLGMFRARAQISAWTVWGCLAFAAFFFASWLYHVRLRIAVDEHGLQYRGIRRRIEVGFGEILRVSVMPTLLLRVYWVGTRKGPLFFSSNLKGHRELCDLLLDRARLASR